MSLVFLEECEEIKTVSRPTDAAERTHLNACDAKNDVTKSLYRDEIYI